MIVRESTPGTATDQLRTLTTEADTTRSYTSFKLHDLKLIRRH